MIAISSKFSYYPSMSQIDFNRGPGIKMRSFPQKMICMISDLPVAIS